MILRRGGEVVASWSVRVLFLAWVLVGVSPWVSAQSDSAEFEPNPSLSSVGITGEGPVRWYIESASQGYASSQYQLGQMYVNGKVIAQDYAEALRWYQLAALQDYPSAQYSLGELYQHGSGIEVDYVTAYAWYHVAAMNRFAPASIARDRLMLMMDAEQISLAHWQVKKLWKRIDKTQKAAPDP